MGKEGLNSVAREKKESQAISMARDTNLLRDDVSSDAAAECLTLGGLKCTYPVQKTSGPSLCGLGGLKLITEGINQYRIYV